MNRVPLHTLVVGGTGMLRGLSLELSSRGDRVAVLARPGRRLEALVEEATSRGGRIFPVPVDYADPVPLEAALEVEVHARGRFDRAVLWVHSDGPRVSEVVAKFVGGPDHPGDLLQVLGSAVADPSAPKDRPRAPPTITPGTTWRDVVLGFVPTPTGSRWLTDPEISKGVMDALDRAKERSVVGVVEPWSARPG